MQITIDQPLIQIEVTHSAGPPVVIEVAAAPQITVQVDGIQGPAGLSGIDLDPGDFTLLFDNRLI